MNDEMTSESLGKLILRLTVGGLMLFHGYAKIIHPGSIEFIGGRLQEMGLPQILTYGVYAGEIIAPVLIILGIFSRVGGALIVINMVFAILIVHMGDLFMLTEHGGWRLELQGFYLFGGATIFLIGSGRFAIRPD